MVIFSSPTKHFHIFFFFQSLRRIKFSTCNITIYLNFHYFWFFTNYDKQSTLTHTVLEKKLCHLQDTVLQCIFPKTHISIYCLKTYIHRPNLWCLSFFLAHLLKKICVCNLADNYFLS